MTNLNHIEKSLLSLWSKLDYDSELYRKCLDNIKIQIMFALDWLKDMSLDTNSSHENLSDTLMDPEIINEINDIITKNSWDYSTEIRKESAEISINENRTITIKKNLQEIIVLSEGLLKSIWNNIDILNDPNLIKEKLDTLISNNDMLEKIKIFSEEKELDVGKYFNLRKIKVSMKEDTEKKKQEFKELKEKYNIQNEIDYLKSAVQTEWKFNN